MAQISSLSSDGANLWSSNFYLLLYKPSHNKIYTLDYSNCITYFEKQKLLATSGKCDE
jgi:hypothetical protein